MTTQQHSPGPEAPAGYLTTMDGDDAPLLGHLVLYSILEDKITPAQVQLWFTELGLDPSFVPAEIRPVDVFEKITAPGRSRPARRAGHRADFSGITRRFTSRPVLNLELRPDQPVWVCSEPTAGGMTSATRPGTRAPQAGSATASGDGGLAGPSSGELDLPQSD